MDFEVESVDQECMVDQRDHLTDESLLGFESFFFVTELHTFVLEDWRGGKIPKLFKQLKEHQPVFLKVFCKSFPWLDETSKTSKLLHQGLS